MKESFFQGAVVLAIGSLIAKVLGFTYRIYVVRLVGSEGIGLYELVFPLITLVLVLTTAGIPVALANTIARLKGQEEYYLITIVIRFSLYILLITGIIFPVIMLYFAPWLLPKIYADPRSYWPFMALLPVIFFVSISSVFRGYFQGISFMLPNALAQLSEQLVRFAFGLILIAWLLPYGIEFGAVGLALAVVIGEIAGLIVLLYFYFRTTLKLKPKPTTVLKSQTSLVLILQQLMFLALPITMSRIVSSVSLSLKAIIIPNRLQAAGSTLQQATQAYGAYSGIALSLISFPNVLTGALGAVLLPTVAMATIKNEHFELQRRVNQGIKLTVLVALPFTVWFFLLPEYLTVTIFHNYEAAILLKLLAPSCIFIYLQQTTGGILLGLGKMKTILLNSALGNLFGLAVTYVLVGSPILKIKGAVIGLSLGVTIICLLNLKVVFKHTKTQLKIADWLRPFTIATLFMILFIQCFSNQLSVYFIILTSGLIYLLVIILLQGLSKKDL
ncbi:MAG: polysaccharide biosynthesis protein [Bacillota bacterium]